jgi:hypothetical protein
MEMTKIILPNVADELVQMHLWRSKFFDKASRCERELRRLLALPANDKSHFKVMAEKLIATKKDEKKSALPRLVDELIPLIELRAELAHSHFVGFSGTESTDAMFENASFSHIHFSKYTVLTNEQRNQAYGRLSWIAGQLAKTAVLQD